MPYRNTDKTEKGFITIELLFAFAILLINMSGILLLVGNSQNLIQNETEAEALQIAKDKINEARALAEFDFNLINPKTENIGPYQSELKITQVDFFTKKLESIVTWQPAPNRTQNTELTTLLTNPAGYASGETCSSVLSGDWQNPEKTEYEFGKDLLKNTTNGFPITALKTFDEKLYVTVNNTSSNFPGTFFIFDIKNPDSTPKLISPVNFDNSPVGEGLNAVALDRRGYAYVASAYTSASQNCTEGPNCTQLQILDISNPSAPTVIKNLKLPSFTTGGKLTSGTTVEYQNGVVYLGTARAGTNTSEFFAIDVGYSAGSPQNPQVLDDFKIGNGINDIFIKNNFAYIASPHSEELKILDITYPSNISQVGRFDAPGGGGNNGNGKSLALVGEKIYFGRTLLTGDEFYILDNKNPTGTLPVLGSKNITFFSANSSVNGILVRDFLAFLITNGGLEIFNISDPQNTVPYTAPLILPPGSGLGLAGNAIACQGNHIFIASKNSTNISYLSVITAK